MMIREKTILIDPAANQGARRNFTGDSIVHVIRNGQQIPYSDLVKEVETKEG